jgi:hypothetical protein
MSPNNNGTKELKNIKKCPNHCGTWIAWNARLNRFIQAKTGEIHHCPKWKPNQQQKTSNKKIKILKGEQIAYVDTIGPAIAGILSVVQEVLKLLRKMDGSITKFQGGID